MNSTGDGQNRHRQKSSIESFSKQQVEAIDYSFHVLSAAIRGDRTIVNRESFKPWAQIAKAHKSEAFMEEYQWVTAKHRRPLDGCNLDQRRSIAG